MVEPLTSLFSCSGREKNAWSRNIISPPFQLQSIWAFPFWCQEENEVTWVLDSSCLLYQISLKLYFILLCTLEGEIGGLSQRAFFSSGICFYLADKKHQKGIGRKRERLACLSSHLRDPVGLPQGCGCRLSPDQRLEPPSGSLCTVLSPSLSLTLFLSPLKIILPLPL